MATHLHLKARFLVAFAVRTLEVVGSRVFSKVLSNCICHSDATAVEHNLLLKTRRLEKKPEPF